MHDVKCWFRSPPENIWGGMQQGLWVMHQAWHLQWFIQEDRVIVYSALNMIELT